MGTAAPARPAHFSRFSQESAARAIHARPARPARCAGAPVHRLAGSSVRRVGRAARVSSDDTSPAGGGRRGAGRVVAIQLSEKRNCWLAGRRLAAGRWPGVAAGFRLAGLAGSLGARLGTGEGGRRSQCAPSLRRCVWRAWRASWALRRLPPPAACRLSAAAAASAAGWPPRAPTSGNSVAIKLTFVSCRCCVPACPRAHPGGPCMHDPFLALLAVVRDGYDPPSLRHAHRPQHRPRTGRARLPTPPATEPLPAATEAHAAP